MSLRASAWGLDELVHEANVQAGILGDTACRIKFVLANASVDNNLHDRLFDFPLMRPRDEGTQVTCLECIARRTIE